MVVYCENMCTLFLITKKPILWRSNFNTLHEIHVHSHHVSIHQLRSLLLQLGVPQIAMGFNTKSWSSMTWMIWGSRILGNPRMLTIYYPVARGPPGPPQKTKHIRNLDVTRTTLIV